MVSTTACYVIRFTDKKTGYVTYMPKGFGFTAHAHTTNLNEAEVFTESATALRWLDNYINPPAFWNSELRHRALIRRQAERWISEVIQLPR